jgi:hypothetical protein
MEKRIESDGIVTRHPRAGRLLGLSVGVAVLLSACVTGRGAAHTPRVSGAAASSAPTGQALPVATVPRPGGPVPSGFVPVSAAFVSPLAGWVLGTAPCPSAGLCRVFAHSETAGLTWLQLPPPPGDVTELSFADARVGYAFGPHSLAVTTDGGRSWRSGSFPRRRAQETTLALEPGAGAVYAALRSRSSAGSRVSLYRASPGRIDFEPIAEAFLADASDAELAFGDASNGYLLGLPPSSGMLVTNDAGTTWLTRQVPCSRATSSTARMATFGGAELYLVCAALGTDSVQAKELLTSVDGGVGFGLYGSLPSEGSIGAAPVDFAPAGLPPPCWSASLVLSRPSPVIAALGNTTATLVLENRGVTSCTLEGYPGLTLFNAGGSRLPIRVADNPSSYIVSARTVEPVILTHGGSASFFVSGSDNPAEGEKCPSAVRAEVDLPGGGAPLAGSVDLAPCGGGVWVSPIVSGVQQPHV